MIISIDIGTSYSSACFLGPDGKAKSLEISTGVNMFGNKYSLPSAVFCDDDGSILVGQAALNKRKTNPSNFCMEFKRYLGQDIPLLLGKHSFLPEELYTEMFHHMKNSAQKISGEKGDKIELAYLTYPASYSAARQQKVHDAAKAAGLFNIKLIDEPTAAAMSYCAAGYIKEGQTLMVYDFGGGTFDASLIRYAGGTFQLLTEPAGLEQCGGIDMDRMIFQDMLNSISEENLQQIKADALQYRHFLSQLSELSVKAKHHLSAGDIFEDNIQVGMKMLSYQLSREKFEQMIAPQVVQTIQICRQILDKSDLTIEKISAILLVGGGSRVPLVERMVNQFAEKTPVYCAPDRDLAVVQGAISYHQFKSVRPEPENADCQVQTKEIEVQYQQAKKYLAAKNYEKAVEFFGKLAEQGYYKAQYRLGDAYYYGKGVTSNYGKAVEWYHKAATQGHVIAQCCLGWCYSNEKGVSRNYAKAAEWYHKAAVQGQKIAQYNLGYFYHKGKGVEKDYEEAIKWYSKAASNGSVEAEAKLKELQKYINSKLKKG